MPTNSQQRCWAACQANKQRIEESRSAVQCVQTSHVEPRTAVLNTQLQAATKAQGWLQTLQGQRYFIGLHLGEEATQTTRTNFSECTLNPPTSPRSLLVEFKYTLYINCSYSLTEKSSIWDEPMKGFFSQLLSLLFGGKYSSNEFCNRLRCSVMLCFTFSDTALPDSSRY
jgi:hypothetical protein